MKITLFPSDKGDCLLLTARDGATLLADGGMRDSYIDHVRPFWKKWAGNGNAGGGGTIDLVYVSHIDQDHIAGVLQMMDDLVAWRVYEHRKGEGWPRPDFPRPPTPRAIWHNAFHEQIGRNSGAIESMLAASAAALSNSASKAVRALAVEYRTIATSIPEAIRLSRRVSPGQLGIPLNKPFKGKLAMVREGQKPTRLGSMKLTVIGPFEEDLKKLRGEWNKWLQEHRKQLQELKRRAEDDEGLLGTAATVGGVPAPLALDVDDELGDRGRVTAPNLASLMLLVEEDGRRVVLTGDAHHREIAEGLRRAKVLPGDADGEGGGHVDVLKVQHHGAEYNINRAFARRLTADHYVFCGNGEHENPDLRVVQVLAESRIGKPQHRSPNAEAGRPFKFWFNSSSTFPGADRGQMKKIEDQVKSFAQQSGGRMEFAFFKNGPLELDL